MEQVSNAAEGTGLDREAVISMYRDMLRIRRIEEAIAERYARKEMRCPVHLSIGQEAAAVGVCGALRPDDRIVTTHRCHGHYLAKGGKLEPMLAELHGRATGCCGGRGGSMHLFDDEAGILVSVPIVGSNVPLGVGAALGFKQRGEPRVVVAFFGDGALEEGAVYEAANFASVHDLPVVFALENNLYSVYTPLEQRQPKRPLTDFAVAHRMPHWRADGNDVTDVWSVARQAVERARRGGGPGLLVLDTYRWLEHCGPHCDDHLGYRPEGELSRFKASCPLDHTQNQLAQQGAWDEDLRRRWERELADEITAAFDAAQAAPFPTPNSAAGGLYA